MAKRGISNNSENLDRCFLKLISGRPTLPGPFRRRGIRPQRGNQETLGEG
jgi:hypothetical protein